MAQQNNGQEQDLNQLRKVRREKLAELQQNGKDPFVITKYEQTHHSQEIKDNFDDYWKVASKITPTTTPTRPYSPPPSSASVHSPRTQSNDPAGAPDRDGAYSVRSIPVRMYLCDGPILQELAPPLLPDGE